ncbi:MAG: hypothetical protein ACHP6H_07260, partial [Legionellales bacterium]
QALVLLTQKAAIIINECQNILSQVDDTYDKERLNAIIRNTGALIELASKRGGKKTPHFTEELKEKCRSLEMDVLSLPSTFCSSSTTSSSSYKISLICFYVLTLSVALAIGATFGAWYFGFLLTGYFTDALATALAAIGIPSLCVGLVSFGVYSAQESPVSQTLIDKVGVFCDALLAFDVPDETVDHSNTTPS